MDEEWRPVVGYEGLYEVSNQGRVRSLDHVTISKDGRTMPQVGKVLSPGIGKYGHRSFNFSKRGVQTTKHLHRIMYESFVGEIPDGMFVRHLDDDPTNTSLENLAIGTQSDNMRDSVRNGNHRSTRVTHCPSGHPYDAENTYVWRGGRKCKKCNVERAPKYRNRKEQ